MAVLPSSAFIRVSRSLYLIVLFVITSCAFAEDASTHAETSPAVDPTMVKPAPRISISPTQLDFKSQALERNSPVQTVTLTAGPESGLKIQSIKASGDFVVTPDTCDLGKSGSCAISVTFVPRQQGASTAALTIVSDGGTSPQVVPLSGTGVCEIPPVWNRAVIVVATAAVMLYFFAFALVRWNMLAQPTRRFLRAQIAAVNNQLEMLGAINAAAPEAIALVRRFLIAASDSIDIDKTRLRHKVADFFFWSRGQEIVGWNYVHEAEEEMTSFLPAATTRAALERAEADLRQMASVPASSLADIIKEALVTPPPIPGAIHSLLREILTSIVAGVVPLISKCDKALESATPSVDTCRTLAIAIAAQIDTWPAWDDQIDQAQMSLQVGTSPQLSALLRQVRDVLTPESATLVQTLRGAISANSDNPIESWRPLLEHARALLRPASSLARDIAQLLKDGAVIPLERWRALLSEALGLIDDRTDTDYATLVSWNNKTVWLLGCALFFIVLLAATLQNALFFLVGAAGGLLSRLSRTLYRDDVPTDYGASWATLFLSPAVGALAGWFGILLVILGVQLQVLGPVLAVSWCNRYSAVALALAFLLGFSERLFDGILNQLQGKILSQPAAAAPQSPSQVAISTSAQLPPATVGQAYNQALTATGGAPPYSWTRIGGMLPTGLTLNASGSISGAPTASGATTFTLQVSDSKLNTKSQQFSMNVT